MFSRQATWSGNTVASRSSDFIRCNCGATFLPDEKRGNASAVTAFQRNRVGNSGASSNACTRMSRAVFECRKPATSTSGKLWLVDSDSTMAFSVAAACSSKLKLRQKRLRKARPQALLMRLPNGAWITRWVEPASSKKRSIASCRCVGSSPNPATCSAQYASNCPDAASHRPTSSRSQAPATSAPCASRCCSASRRRETACDSASLRPGASPSQNGIDGGAPCASSTRNLPGSILRMR